MAEGGGAGAGGLPGGAAGGGYHIVGGGTDPQGGRGLLRYMTSVGGVEVSGGDSKSLLHSLHQLSRRPPWFPGGLWHRYCSLRGQTASSGNSHEGRGPVRNIYGLAQGV